MLGATSFFLSVCSNFIAGPNTVQADFVIKYILPYYCGIKINYWGMEFLCRLVYSVRDPKKIFVHIAYLFWTEAGGEPRCLTE